METVFLDTETTGLDPRVDRIVELAIIDEEGATQIDTLINPQRIIPGSATAIHGITAGMVALAPSLDDLAVDIKQAVTGKRVVIYNAGFDMQFLSDGLASAAEIRCAMLRFAEVYGEWNCLRGSYRWKKLDQAARHIGYHWEGEAHRALSDAKACRAVWNWLEAGDQLHSAA